MWVRIRSHLWRQCETWVWFLTSTWKWICKSQKPAKTPTIISTTSGESEKFLSQEATCTVIHAFITNQFDYCNCLMNGPPENLIKKLQRVQKHSCQTSFQSQEIWSHNSCTRYASLASSPIPDWIQNTVNRGKAPTYIQEMITPSKSTLSRRGDIK